MLSSNTQSDAITLSISGREAEIGSTEWGPGVEAR